MADSPVRAWRCGVCGYVHRGAGPPEVCPVCGAAGSEFEPYADEPPAAAKAERWRCLNCSAVHEGSDPPEVCGVCGAPREAFEPLAAAAAAPAGSTEAFRAVVVGAGIAGIAAVESILRSAPGARVCLISKEAELPYYRLNLTRYLAGEIGRDELPIHPQDWYEQHGVELLGGAEVSALSPAERKVALRDGREVGFDRLVLTVGAHPFIPPFAGTAREGVFSLRTAGDAERILAAAGGGGACACIGGGLLGIETAGALARRGAEVTLLEGHAWLMPRQLGRRAGELLADHVARAGIRLVTEARTEEIVGDERAAGVRLEDGRTLAAETVVIATGVRPNSHLARRAGLEVNQGVVVDNHLRTSQPEVLAAGDVAEHRGVLYGSWAAAQYQGGIAGMNAAGAAAEFGGIPRSNRLKVLGLELMSVGRFEADDASDRVVEGEEEGRYLRFVFHDGRLVGAILLGDAAAGGAAKKAIEGGADCSGLLAARPAAADVAEKLMEAFI